MDATILNRLGRVRDLDQLAGGLFRFGELAVSGDFRWLGMR
jgi:hypothetical protein